MYTDYRSIDTNTPQGWAANYQRTDRLAPIKFRLDPCWRYIRRYLNGGPVLDAGCGGGDWAAFLSRRGYQMFGLDYSLEVIDDNKKRLPHITWLHGRVQEIPLPSESLAGVISWGVIEHDPDGPGAALREFHRILKPGGHIIVTVPIDTPNVRYAAELQVPKGPTFFQFYFTPGELADATAAAGFVPLEFGPLKPAYPVIWPKAYIGAGRVRQRLMSIASLAYPKELYALMTYCVAKKPA